MLFYFNNNSLSYCHYKSIIKKINIIYPVYNVEKEVEKSFESIIKQTYKDFEVIIINDGTPDRSMDIIYELIEKYKFENYRVINHEINNGVYAARNIGLDSVNSEFVLFMDSDDILPFDSINNLMNCYQENKDVDMVLGRELWSDFDKKFHTNSHNILRIENNDDIYDAYWDGKWSIMVYNKLIKILKVNY